MNVKIQSSGIAGCQNTGSCRGYAVYLEHETKQKHELGMDDDIIPFYDMGGRAIDRDTVIEHIDSNRSGLHANDAKFFSQIISFSEEEVGAMGGSREERIEAVHAFVEKTMDNYAERFGFGGESPHMGLCYYYTIHEYRDGDDNALKPGLHVHMIISRKDVSGKYKLSPMTNHRKGSLGIIKRGFNRDDYFQQCESTFDRMFSYARPVDQSYRYYNTMIHGTAKQKREQMDRLAQQREISGNISRALSNRAIRLAKEATRESPLSPNEFWNSYHSYYKPQIDALKSVCDRAFTMYSDAKTKYHIRSVEIDSLYRDLETIYKSMNSITDRINREYECDKRIDNFVNLVTEVNPIAGLVLAITVRILRVSNKEKDIATRMEFRRRALAIQREIAELQKQQLELKNARNDSLRQYISVKDERESLKKQVSILKGELSRHLAPGLSLDSLEKGYQQHKLKKAIEEVPKKEIKTSDLVLDLLTKSPNKIMLDVEMASSGVLISPIYSDKGGVADFKITRGGEIIRASQCLDGKNLIECLDKWQMLTGEKPTYKIEEELNNEKLIKQNTWKMKI